MCVAAAAAGCFVASAEGKCRLCAPGLVLNADLQCDAVALFACPQASLGFMSEAGSQADVLRYQLQRPAGCARCEAGSVLSYLSRPTRVCVQSAVIQTENAQKLQGSKVFIENCALYSLGADGLPYCASCKQGFVPQTGGRACFA